MRGARLSASRNAGAGPACCWSAQMQGLNCNRHAQVHQPTWAVERSTPRDSSQMRTVATTARTSLGSRRRPTGAALPLLDPPAASERSAAMGEWPVELQAGGQTAAPRIKR